MVNNPEFIAYGSQFSTYTTIYQFVLHVPIPLLLCWQKCYPPRPGQVAEIVDNHDTQSPGDPICLMKGRVNRTMFRHLVCVVPVRLRNARDGKKKQHYRYYYYYFILVVSYRSHQRTKKPRQYCPVKNRLISRQYSNVPNS